MMKQIESTKREREQCVIDRRKLLDKWERQQDNKYVLEGWGRMVEMILIDLETFFHLK